MESLKRPEVLAFINPRNHHTDPSVREYGCLDPATDTVNGFSVSTDSEFEETHEYDYETLCTIQEMVALVTSTDSANPVPQETTGGTPKTAEKTYEWVAEDRIYDPPRTGVTREGNPTRGPNENPGGFLECPTGPI